jgi:hypothetical protein
MQYCRSVHSLPRKGSLNMRRAFMMTSESLPLACSVEEPSKFQSGHSEWCVTTLSITLALLRTSPLPPIHTYSTIQAIASLKTDNKYYQEYLLKGKSSRTRTWSRHLSALVLSIFLTVMSHEKQIPLICNQLHDLHPQNIIFNFLFGFTHQHKTSWPCVIVEGDIPAKG